MSEGTNGIAKPEDFRNFAEASAWAEGERIMLPKSGLAVRVRRPTIMYFKLRRTSWPGELIAKLEEASAGAKLEYTAEERLFVIREDQRMLELAFVEPKLALHPGPDQFDPNWLPQEDALYILRYLRGEVLADGTDLESFRRGQSGLPADGGGVGGDVRADAGGDAEQPAADVGA